jgi:hypothetical protein
MKQASTPSTKAPRALSRSPWSVPALLASLATACAGGPQAAAPGASASADFAEGYVAALQAEQIDPVSATPYLDLIDQAVAQPDAPGALPAAIAAVDALVTGNTPGFEGLGSHAVAYRSRELVTTVVDRLRRAWYAGGDARATPSANLAFIRGNIALGLHDLALFVGDAPAAATWSARRGCVPAATVVGPLDWTALRGLDDPSVIKATEPLAASYPGVPPFAAGIAPAVVHADQCILDVNAQGPLQGLRAVAVDLTVPRAQTIRLALTASVAAVVEVGGVPTIRRGFEAGGRPVMRLGSIEVPAGQVRVVVRVAYKGEGGLIELDAWSDDGQPLESRAPKPGDVASVAGGKAEAVEITSPADSAVVAAALLALGESRVAEHLLEPSPGSKITRSPAIELLYARAVEAADDLPDNKIVERLRGAIDRTLAGWPDSWEARVSHARATERRRGAGEGLAEALRELGARPEGGKAAKKPAEERAARPWDRMVAAYVAATARRAQLLDVSEKAFAELLREASGSPLHAGIDARLHPRVGADAVKAACHGALRKSDLDCYEAHRDQAAFGEAFKELARLRRLRGAPSGLREAELSTRIVAGDLKGALAVYDAMAPGERRMLDVLGLAAGQRDQREARSRVARDRRTARDAPYSIGPLSRVLGLAPDPAPALEVEGRRLVLADQKAAFLPGAGTAVLRRVERYDIDATGLCHFLTYDLRRVSGTTDVAQGAIAYGPGIEGRTAPRLLRKRIHKRDGRLLEPDAAANAQQASDLSQLEQGDYVEQIAEGWALPGDTGQIVIDTPDLLPERTSVREATIEVRRAASIPFAIWSHPLLGAAAERVDGDFMVSAWRLENQPPRRIEDGVPKMERGVAVSLGTQTWDHVARGMEENIRALSERDPYVSRWIAEAAGEDRTVGKALVDRVVLAAGKKVKVAAGSELSDVAGVFGGGSQRTTARTILELGQGSRSWVVYRALRELGVKVNLAIAETEPFSAVPSFPPHVGRFRHPLVVAHLGDAGGDVWIDADVDGPPLPPGRISPELRGRAAMLDSGAIVTVEGGAGETGDEVDVRLALDERGDARGSFTVLLHGRAAQSLAELFETVVGTDRREMLRSVVLGWLPWADVEDVAVSSTEGSWEVALRATIAIHGFGRPEGKDGKTWVLAGLEPVHVVFPRGTVGMLGATYASRGARQNALSIESPLQYHFHRRIELPAGATILRAPAGLAVTGMHIHAQRTGTVKGRVIDEDFSLSLPTGTVSPAHYPSFVDSVQAIDDGFMTGTRIRVKP